jgi:lipopolysaccharide export system protein LptA
VIIFRARALRPSLSLVLALACGSAAVAGSPVGAGSPQPAVSPPPGAHGPGAPRPSTGASAPAQRSPAAPTAAQPAAPQAGASAGSLNTKFYHIETDETDSNFGTGDFKMPHKVRFSRPGTDATADRAEGNDKRGTVTLIGNVVVHDSGGQATLPGTAAGGGVTTTLTTDRLEIDSKAKNYTAIGNVHFSQGDRTGSAQRGQLDRGSNVLRLEGAVNLNDATSSVNANTVVYNLGSKDVDVQGSPAVLKQTPQGGGTDTVQTAQIHYNQNSGDFTMPGKAQFSRPGTEANGDRANGNTKRGTLTLSGNVTVHDSGNAPEVGDKAYGGNGPADLSCNTLDVDAKSKIYIADGNVKFSQGTRTGAAEHGTLDRGSGKLRLERNVKLTDGESSMSSNSIDYNLTTKDVVVHGGPIIIKQPVPSSEPRPAASSTPKPKRRLPF